MGHLERGPRQPSGPRAPMMLRRLWEPDLRSNGREFDSRSGHDVAGYTPDAVGSISSCSRPSASVSKQYRPTLVPAKRQ